MPPYTPEAYAYTLNSGPHLSAQTALALSLENQEKWQDLRMEFYDAYQELIAGQELDEETIHCKKSSYSRMLRMAHSIARQGTAAVKAYIEQGRGFYSAYS